MNGGRELQKPDRICHGGPALADSSCYLFMSPSKIFQELPVSRGLLKRAQILALDVFDQCFREVSAFAPFCPNDCGNHREAGQGCRPAPSLAGDKGVNTTGVSRAHDHRLQDSDFPNGSSQGLKEIVIESTPGLGRIGNDVVQADRRKTFIRAVCGEQGV